MQERPTFEFIPDVCKESVSETGETSPPAYVGKIILFQPDIDERYGILEQAGPQLSEGGDSRLERGMRNIGFIRGLLKASKPFYKSVEISRVSDGKEYKSYADLSYDPVFDKTINAIAMKLSGNELNPN